MTSPAGLDGAALRQALTAIARAHDGDEARARAAAASLLRDTLDTRRAMIEADLHAGASGRETARALARLSDHILSALYDFVTVHIVRARNPTSAERLAVCAVGGYGRGLLAPSSDLDLLFLHPYKRAPWVEGVTEFMLYTLWDMGVDVGHSVRSIDHAFRLAREDWTVLTALMDLRSLAGDRALAEELAGRLADGGIKGRARAFTAAKLSERETRIARLGGSAHMVEPDVKDGEGGLRDVQTLDWLARGAAMARGGRSPAAELFQREEADALEEAGDFLWRVRAVMHFLVGRRHDRLTFDLQPEVAARMGFSATDGALGVERLMRVYFLHTRKVMALSRLLRARLDREAGATTDTIRQVLRRPLRLRDTRLCWRDARVAFADPDVADHDPTAAPTLFRIAAGADAEPHPDSAAAATRALERLDAPARSDPNLAEAFLAVFDTPERVEPTLRSMNDAGALGALIPEFAPIVARTQFNMYHHYTVDEHTMRVVGALADLERGEDPSGAGVGAFAADVFTRITNRRALYLAALMHDTGKGAGDQQVVGAQNAEAVARRLGFNEEDTALTAWLVRRHLLMSDVAQRRDLGDPDTVIRFAQEVASLERLRALTVLTIADITGVGPGVMTTWKGQLLQELFELTAAVFRGGRTTAEHARAVLRARADAARATLIGSVAETDADFARDWAEQLEDAYWIGFDEEAHRRHCAFALSALMRGDPIAVDACWIGGAGVAEVMVLAPDRPGLLSRLAEAIARSGASVRGARVYTTVRGAGVQVFNVEFRGVEFDDWAALSTLRAAVETAAGGSEPRPRPPGRTAPRLAVFDVAPTVTFDPQSHGDASVLEVSSRDRAGLLADLCHALAEADVNIASAHVESYGERVMDTFYLTEHDGGPIADPDRREHIRHAVIRVLTGDGAPPPKVGAISLSTAPASDAR